MCLGSDRSGKKEASLKMLEIGKMKTVSFSNRNVMWAGGIFKN